MLASQGWDGLARRIDHQVAVADHARRVLRARGFTVVNDTPLPLVCFTHPRLSDLGAHAALALRLKRAQSAWISATQLAGAPALRMCVTSYQTGPDDVDAVVAAIEAALA